MSVNYKLPGEQPTFKRKNDRIPLAELDMEVERVIIPERGLLVGILGRALLDLTSPDMSEVMDAREWFISTAHSPWSFKWLCEQLDLPEKRILELLDTTLWRPADTKNIFTKGRSENHK